ncbi:MAG: S8 family peptidase [Gemmatimonadaceae bacterium]
MKRALTLSLVAFVAACGDAGTPASPIAAPSAEASSASKSAVIPGQYIVVFRDQVSDAHRRTHAKVSLSGGVLRHSYTSAIKGFSAILSPAAVAALRDDPDVAYVEQDQVMQVSSEQTGATWGLDRIDQHARPTDGLYHYAATGAGVTAYIIDTGIETTHPEFGGRASVGYDAVGDGRNGIDCDGHGTHVSGTVGGNTYGVAKGVALVAVRVFDCSGAGTISGVIAGLDWVTANHAAHAVVNMSLNAGTSSSLDAAVKRSIASGMTYVIAAGNGNTSGVAQDACKTSPARVGEAITVGATDSNDAKASWSNYGNCVDFFAPGLNITSAWLNGGTNTISGTSMATPHVTGVAALYLQGNPGATPQAVRDALFNATTKDVVTSSRTVNNHLLYTGY